MKFVEAPQEVDPMSLIKNFQKNKSDRAKIFCIITFFIASLLVLPVLFSVKCDSNPSTLPWLALWTPMWIVDLVLLGASVMHFCIKSVTPEEKARRKAEKENNNAADATHEDEDTDDDIEDDTPFSTKVFGFITTSLFVLIQIFVLMKLDKVENVVDWNWFAVFAPWFLYEFFVVTALIHPAFIEEIKKPIFGNIHDPSVQEEGHDEEDKIMKQILEENAYFSKIFMRSKDRKTIVVCLLRSWQAIFLAVKLNQTVRWNWGAVFVPIWIFLFYQYCYAYMLKIWAAREVNGVDTEALMANPESLDPLTEQKLQRGQILNGASSMLCFTQLSVILMSVLLVSRLESTTFSTFIIILPVFLGIGFCACAAFCFVICLGCINTEKLDEEMARGENDSGAAGQSNSDGSVGSADLETPILASYNKQSNESADVIAAPNSSLSNPVYDPSVSPVFVPPTVEAILPPPAPAPPTTIDEDID